ncbi:hypothetical protein GmRootV15_38160 [Variovorax sp. V15]
MKDVAEEAKGLRRPAAGAVGGWPGHALPQRPKAVAKAGIRACGVPLRAVGCTQWQKPSPSHAQAQWLPVPIEEARARGVPDPLTVAGAAQESARPSISRENDGAAHLLPV